MHLRTIDVSHVREVNELTALFVIYRFNTCAASKHVVRYFARLDEDPRLSGHRTEVVAFAVGIVSIRLCSQSCSIYVVASKLTVSFHVCAASDIASKSATMNLLESESSQSRHPCNTADVIAQECIRVIVCSVIASVIELLVFFRYLLVVIVYLLLEVDVCLVVPVLVQIAVFDTVNSHNAVVVNLCSRLCIYFSLSNLCICTVSGSEHRELWE